MSKKKSINNMLAGSPYRGVSLMKPTTLWKYRSISEVVFANAYLMTN